MTKSKSKNTKNKKTKGRRTRVSKAKRVVIADTTSTNHARYVSELDKMYINKVHPGSMPCKYVAAGEITSLPTMTFQTGFTLNYVWDVASGSSVSPGTSEYLVIMWAPSLSFTTGGDLLDSFSSETHAGGLSVFQTNALNTNFVLSDFYHNNTGYTQVGTYGTNFEAIANSGGAWASQIDLQVLAPEANMIGNVFTGQMLLGSFYDPGDSGEQSVNVGELIRVSQTMEKKDGKISLKGAIQNHNLPFELGSHTSDSQNYYRDAALRGEIVSFAVVQRAAASITSGDRVTFSLNGRISSNWVFWPSELPDSQNLFYSARNDVSDVPIQNSLVHKKSTLRSMIDKASSIVRNPITHYLGKGAKWLIGQTFRKMTENPLGFASFVGGQALKLAPLLAAEGAGEKKIFVDISDLTYRVHSSRAMPHTGDPKLMPYITAYNNARDSLRRAVSALPEKYVIDVEESNPDKTVPSDSQDLVDNKVFMSDPQFKLVYSNNN